MLKELLGDRIRVGLAKAEMREISDESKQASLHVEDVISAKAEKDCLRVEFTRHVWFEPASSFEAKVTYFVEHELKEQGGLEQFTQSEVDEEVKKDPKFYIQEGQGFVARVSVLISQMTLSFGGAPLITPPGYIRKKED